MGFRELIKQVQHKSGFSDAESQEALVMTVKTVAERLREEEREEFASQLPSELQDVALHAEADDEKRRKDILQEFMEEEDIDEAHAKKQLLSAWDAIRETVSPEEINDIRSQLPNTIATLLS